VCMCGGGEERIIPKSMPHHSCQGGVSLSRVEGRSLPCPVLCGCGTP